MSLVHGAWAVFARECVRLVRNPDLLLITLVAPLVYAAVLPSIYVHKRVEDVPIGVIDRDGTQLSRTVVRWADATSGVRVAQSYPDAAAAQRDVLAGTIRGFLYIPAGFTEDVKRGKAARLLAGVDSCNFLVSNPVALALSEVAGTISAGAFIKTLKKSTGMVHEKALAVNQAVVLDARVLVNPELNYSDFMIPGLLVVILQQILLVGLAFSIAEERENGREAELMLLARGHLLALLAGKVLPYALVNFGLGVLFIGVGLPIFGVPLAPGWPAALPLFGAFVLAITSFGVLLSSFFRSTVHALVVLMFYSMPTFLLSGFSWPGYMLDWPLRALSHLFPSTWFLNDFRLQLLGDLPFRYALDSIIALLVFTAVCTAVNFWWLHHAFRKKQGCPRPAKGL